MNIQPNISTSKKSIIHHHHNIHLDNIYKKHKQIYDIKHLKNTNMKHLEQKLLVTS